MGKTTISASLFVPLFVTGLAACGEPKQAWERPREPVAAAEGSEPETKKEDPPPAAEASPPKEVTHEDVCRKMWSHIEADANAKLKKGGTKKPTDKDRSEFLKGCYDGAGDQKANPEKYACRKKCIMESEALPDVETCMKSCK
jgi:hypothetical protein